MRGETLVEAVQRLSLARTLPEVQEIVAGTARALCGADGATFVLREGDFCRYADEDAISPLWKGQRFPLETCISGWAMLHREAVAIPDITVDARIPQEAYRPTFVRSLAMVPIRRLDPIGAIGNYWAEPHEPTAEEIELLQALADSTAVALENVRIWGDLELNERVLGSLAHEIRNALTASSGLVEVALRTTPELPEPTRKMLTLALGAARDGARFVGEQLAAAQDRAGELEPQPGELDVRRFLADVRAVHDALRRDDRVRLLVAEEDCPETIRTDPYLLGMAMRNLVGNALKFTEEGEIVIGARAEAGGDVTFSVRDTGVGINPAQHHRVFEAWAQTDGDHRGNGLGLPFVRRIAVLLGGEVTLDSTPGHGSTFAIRLPAVPPREVDVAA